MRRAPSAVLVAASCVVTAELARAEEPPGTSTAPVTSAAAASVSTESPAAAALRKADEATKKFDELVESLPFKLHGGALLWYYQPLRPPGGKNKLELYAGYFTFDYCFDDLLGFHFEPRFRDTKLRPYFQSNFWVQEIYAYVPTPVGVLKGGKEYQHLGYFWDDSFYGNAQYFDGMKLNPNYGFSFEGSTADWKFLEGAEESSLACAYFLQFFVTDGSTEGALDKRDVLSYGARKRDIFSARIEPSFAVTPDVKITLGGFGEYWRADFDTPSLSNNVVSFGGDARIDVGPFAAYGEYAQRKGMTAPDFPVAGALVSHKDYTLVGAKLDVWRLTFRLNVSHVRYEDDGIEETFVIPQVTIALHKHASLLFEYAYWWRHAPHSVGRSDYQRQDNSMNFVLTVSF